MRALVTGGAGFIGSALVRHLVLALGWQVLTYDALTYAGHRSSLKAVEAAPNHRFVHADICDGAAFTATLDAFRPELIFHLAAESHVDRSIAEAAPFVRTNIVGTQTLLDAAVTYWRGLSASEREKFRFVQVSTDEVYGALGSDGAFTEASPYAPSSPYSASKAAADHLGRACHHTHGLPVIVSASTNTYGPYQSPEKLIPLVILAALHERSLPIYGDGLQVRDWLHVSDHIAALVQIGMKGFPGETYLVGARNERTNLDLVHEICAALDRQRPTGVPHARLIAHVADRPGHDRRYAVDPAKLEQGLGWRPAVGFGAGLDATVAWYLENAWWWTPLGTGPNEKGERNGSPSPQSV